MSNYQCSSGPPIQPSTYETPTWCLTLRHPTLSTDPLSLERITSSLPAGVSVQRTRLAELGGITITGEASSNNENLFVTLVKLIILLPTTANSSWVGSSDADLTYDEYCRLAR